MESTMLNQSRYAALRPLYPAQDKSGLSDLLFDNDTRKADTWLAHVADLRSRRQVLQDQIDAKAEANEQTILAPLRIVAAGALEAHVAASVALEAARIRCESECAALRNQISELTTQMAPPMFPEPGIWKTPDAPQIDAREAAAAASTPMKVGGGWIDNNKIDPGMPADLGPMNAKAN
jgi:hypothetical protein